MAGADFRDQLVHYLAVGYVYSTPEAFFMIEPVIGDSGNTADTWHVAWLAGNIRECFRVLPFNLEYIQFRRNGGELRRYGFKKLKEKIYGRH